MESDIKKKMEKLGARAERLRSLLSYAQRAFVIEFAGTPKSGKSTSCEAIRHFFSRHGFSVHVLAERAAVCPIPMKGHLFFNTWCATSMLAELLENVETEINIIIVDRGLFDALVWMKAQENREELSPEEARAIEGFLLLDRWRELIDLTVVMSVSPKEAISREESNHITSKSGSIMNPEVLATLSDSISKAVIDYADKFNFTIHSTTGHEVRPSNIQLAKKTLKCLEAFLNPEVLVVPKKKIAELPLNRGGAFGKSAVKDAYDCISAYGTFITREQAEANKDYVQIIPCGVLMYEDKVFVFQRKDSDPKYELYGKTTIWQGSHVVKREGIKLPELLVAALQKRISRFLFLSRTFPISRLGYCWDRENAKSNKHFGIIYKMNIDNELTAADLKKKEFRKQRGFGLSGNFDDIEVIKAKINDLQLENWSRSILEGVFSK